MSDSGGVLGRMNGALCAIFCAGVDKVEGLEQLARFEQFADASWMIDADPVWHHYQPDTALRPPDMTADA